MNWKELREAARKKLKGYCRVCPSCDGRACAGEVPGMGGTGTGASFMANIEALARYRLNLRTLHGARNPDTSLTLFGKELTTPILAAPMTGVTYNMGGALTEREFIGMIMSGARQAGTLGMSGDSGDPVCYTSGLEAIAAEGGHGIPVIKPREQQAIIERIRRAEEAGAPAVGVDVDGAGLVTMALFGQPVGPKTADELRELVKATRLPFIVKGIMTVDEAELAADAGTAAIVVSNHGGRILDHTPGAAEVLPAIARAVKGRVTILADGGIRSGVDVLKLLALGADAVLVGRPLVVGAFGGGAEGVKFVLEKLTGELKQAMILTGCASLSDIDERVLRPYPGIEC
ncbi:alpha-hydroxy-acid oxidizing protein [Desulfofundulus thermosubterraneus]|uniref:L-lactate oxidase n=1 Tax=Desulfofundulus thermosubterraneus DSM 16057 TaxID=1121432 RepID=A0A1M6ALD7_9FIRM|nr:alpha-hydroxy-acid oxidizing protein [Desulfofundulus thermosubterraneus]SHI37251.1 FMN-dependent dehydrogenase, includes L-lactate dehydrogenase and type II isopentenyl diphosphate isomerase [Desulfofundulus thermosubterraneus DSM 16057]